VGKYADLKLAARPFLTDLPAGLERAAGDVGLFVGCGANYVYPEAAAAAVGLLKAAGVRPFVPPEQVCCGLPAWSAGDAASAAELAGRNLAAFEGLERVVVLCASCAHRLRGIEGLSKVVMLSELLAERPPEGGRQPGRRLKVAYHAPCHVRFEGGAGAARGLLASVPGVELLPVEDACCGSGGLFSLSHPRLSAAIGRERLRGLLAGGPDLIATDCSGCLIQLRAGLAELGRKVPVVHVAQVGGGKNPERHISSRKTKIERFWLCFGKMVCSGAAGEQEIGSL
jgi:glycolate oxidase iron-sulfur subunit